MARVAFVVDFLASDEASRGGWIAAAGMFGSSAKPSLVVLATDRTALQHADAAKYINVSIAEQRLRAYEYGRLVRTFLISTGLPTHPTPIGDFAVRAKPYKVHYRWSYGPRNKDNYDLGWVTWNLQFFPHIYVHYAPWNHNFGQRRSHGCVNVDKENARWIYDWGEVGMPITIQP